MYIVNVNAEKVMGKIKPVHGIENSPVVYGASSQTAYWKKAGFPFARLHDTDYPRGPVVDIPRIFPDFKADENDPANYDFTFTDELIKALIGYGVEPYFRLGVTIENQCQIKAYRIHPPKDYGKWARICEHIVMKAMK